MGLQLPFTGIELPFSKRRPLFIKEAPTFEPTTNAMNRGNISRLLNEKKIGLLSASKPNDAYPRLVYDCAYGANVLGAVPISTPLPGNPKTSRYFEKLPNFYQPKGPNDSTLIFESRFESGNLFKAYQTADFEYDLELKSDYGSPHYQTQWFYFRVSNTREGQVYKFNIVNLIKPDSLYNHGMRPLLYSKQEAKATMLGWHRSCYDIKYFPSKKKANNAQQTQLYTLSFTMQLHYNNDKVYFAHCYPYTYSDCQLMLKRICLPSYSKDRLRRTDLCKTLAGNTVELLMVTNFTSSEDAIAERKCIIISSRVHPGESNASFIMEGFLEFIVSNDRDARSLRDLYVFKIVPMLNPDGVIVGNYRTSLSGFDLNRQWAAPCKQMSSEIFSMKQMIRKTLECRQIHLFVDIHGHSRQSNLFLYGCQPDPPKTQTGLVKKTSSPAMTQRERLLPVIMEKTMDWFSVADCSYVIHKSKETCGRVSPKQPNNISLCLSI